MDDYSAALAATLSRDWLFVTGVPPILRPWLPLRRGPGRPKKHEDRKAYRAQKAREYRQRDKLKEGPRDA